MRNIEVEITVPARDRVVTLPRITANNTEAAFQRLGWLRRTAAADQQVIEEAERIVAAIGGSVGVR